MPEVRPINANDLMRDVLGLTIVSPEVMNYANAVAVAIANTPTIDAVPVVRCMECKFRGFDSCPMCHDEYTYDEDDGGDYYTVDNTTDDGFCHLGAKMDAKD